MISPSTVPRSLMTPVFEDIVCPWTAENPRHDHQLIFPLDADRLMLVWSEYYASSPASVHRTRFDTAGGFADQAPCRITAKITTDAGRTWGPRFTLQENTFGLNLKHPNLVRTGGQNLLFTFTAWESESAERNVYMKRSSDNGESWSGVTQISEPGWYCTNNDHVVRLRSGRILLPSHGGPGFVYRGGESQLHSFVFISDDGGESWVMSADTMTAPGRGAHEPSIVELSDGRLLCFLRTTNERIYHSYSDDQGMHWTTPEPTDLAAPDSPPLLKHLPGTNDLLLLWNNVPSKSNWPRTPLTCAVSHDEGRSWEHVQDIDRREEHDAAYASVCFHGDEALVAYYSRGTYWARDCEITLRIYRTSQFTDTV